MHVMLSAQQTDSLPEHDGQVSHSSQHAANLAQADSRKLAWLAMLPGSAHPGSISWQQFMAGDTLGLHN